jgi:hypothetical protein
MKRSGPPSISFPGTKSLSNTNLKQFLAKDDFVKVADEVMLRIFRFLSHKDFKDTALVCRRWNMITNDRMIWKLRLSESEAKVASLSENINTNLITPLLRAKLHEKLMDEVSLSVFYKLHHFDRFVDLYQCSKWSSYSTEKFIQKTPNLEEDEERLNYLAETLKIIADYFNRDLSGSQSERLREGVSIEIYCKLVCILLKELKNVMTIFKDILAGKTKMNENFDIVELSLRRFQHTLIHN